eukprot:81147_1
MKTWSALPCSCIFILVLLTLFLPSYIIASYDYNDWIGPSSPTLPRDVYQAAAGYDSTNNRIWILGDAVDGDLLTSYDIDSVSFAAANYSASSSPYVYVSGTGDFYTQSDDILYMLYHYTIATFNVNTAQITSHSETIAIPHFTAGRAMCLASIDDVLFVLGGGTSMAHVQVLNFTSNTWIVSPDVDYLNQGRVGTSCIVHPHNNALYAIGGFTDNAYLQTIEKLYVGDLAQISEYSWEFIESLPNPVHYLRSVVYENEIVSVAGYGNDNHYDVFAIDVTSDTVRLAGSMALLCVYPAFVAAGNALYSFGGWFNKNRFQYVNMSQKTSHPTAVTANPTLYPSKTPTITGYTYPTNTPTAAPTMPYDYNNWIEPNQTMPRDVYQAAVGYDSINSRIWIIGSSTITMQGSTFTLEPRQLISYDIDSDLFTDYNATALSHPVSGRGDFYTQIDDILYMIDTSGTKLSTFNVKTAQFTYYYQNIDIPLTVDTYGESDGCLASIDDALFVLGGGHGNVYKYEYVQVLNLTSSTWIYSPDIAYLNEGRLFTSCVVHPYNNALYVIGGYNRSLETATIEKLYVGDLAQISQYSWEFIESLPHPMLFLRSVVYGNDIVSVGGKSNWPYEQSDEVFVIDVRADTVRLSGFMAFDCRYAGFIVTPHVLYSFGGMTMSLNRFQYLSTPTADPTPQPTVAPSAQTMAPSRTPTIKPTMIPTLVPSNAPSWSPSPAPSNAPSNAPTNNPIASDDFDYLLEITYVLKAVDSDDKKKIANDPFNVTNDIQNIIKNEYVADDPISHEEFLIDIQRIQGTKIKNIDSRFALIKWTNIQSLELQTRIECTDYACASIKEQSKDENDFAESVTATLQTYFNNSDLQFEVEGDADELEIVAKYAPAEAEPDDYMLYGIGSVCGLLGLIGVLALLFNKGYIPQFSGSSIVDNAQFAAVFVFTLQFWDFYSDVNLSVEIWNHPELNRSMPLLVSAIGSSV